MKKENNKCNCPSCDTNIDTDYMEKCFEIMATNLAIQKFPEVWKEKREELENLSKKELAEKAYFNGAFEMLKNMKVRMEPLDKKEN